MGNRDHGYQQEEHNSEVLHVHNWVALPVTEVLWGVDEILSECVFIDMSTAMSRAPMPQMHGNGKAFSGSGSEECEIPPLI